MAAKSAIRGRKVAVASNVYTAILALAVGVVVASCCFVAIKCYFEYGTIFQIVGAN